MAVKFCPKCGNVLVEETVNGKLKCSACGYEKKGKPVVEKEKIKNKDVGEGIAREEDVFASYSHKCPECGYMKAEIIDLGAQYSDEDELILVRCGKCGYTERVEKKVG